MRCITIPQDIKIVQGDGNLATIAFVQMMVFQTWTIDKAFGDDLESVFAAVDLRALFKDKKPGEVVELPGALWSKLVAVVRSPSGGYIPQLAVEIVPFFRAITDAPETP